MHIMRDGAKSVRIENFADYLYRYRGVTFNNSGSTTDLVIGAGIHQKTPGTITTNNTVCIPYKIVGFTHY